MMTRPPAVLVLLLACVSWPSLPRCAARLYTEAEHLEPSFANRLALFEHVLLNDAQWSPVLKQKVKLLEIDLPRFPETVSNSAVVDRIRPVAKDAEETTPLLVLQNVLEKSPWSGTNVNYAASVLSAGFTCFTYNNVSFLITQINEINEVAHSEEKLKSKHEEINRMLDDVRMTFVVFMDMVAAVDGDLDEFVKGLYDYDSADEDGSDITQLNVLKFLKEDVDKDFAKRCNVVASSDGDYLSKCNIQNTPSDEAASMLEQKMARFDKIVNCMIDVYDGLDVEAMPMDTWIRILEYNIPISKQIKFFIDDTPMVRSSEGTRTKRFIKALQLASKEETPEEKKEKKEKKKKKKKKKSKKQKKN
ncbi:uncharacterized protein LOC113553521 [Rhopalosiphum maidis]|uniref:uncharacterized protein LOC113553521 n=1 Tax=Rhopalosiphum maidis TaxID=43146 RepID=UPI000F006F91|nr:uncharacterized protein LOC113553521 [Rhopalosiphum maidis]